MKCCRYWGLVEDVLEADLEDNTRVYSIRPEIAIRRRKVEKEETWYSKDYLTKSPLNVL